MSVEDPDQPDPAFYGLQKGIVVSRLDPLGLARVRVRIPGLIEEQSAWARPLFPGAGSQERGMHWVPEVGAEVGILFLQGDPDWPYYLGGDYGAPEGRSEVPVPAIDHGPDVRVMASKGWRIILDDREGNETLKIEDKLGLCKIEIDGVTRRVLIHGTAALMMDAVGPVDIRGLTITLNGRPVLPGGPIT